MGESIGKLVVFWISVRKLVVFFLPKVTTCYMKDPIWCERKLQWENMSTFPWLVSIVLVKQQAFSLRRERERFFLFSFLSLGEKTPYGGMPGRGGGEVKGGRADNLRRTCTRPHLSICFYVTLEE